MMQNNQNFHIKIIAGIDDATKCPCIGSIFIAGVIANTETIENWKSLGVKDSKLIAKKKRYKLAKIIKETAIGFFIQEITPQMVDDKTIFNLNDWEMLIVLKILNYLKKVAQLDEVYIDNWEVNQNLFKQRLKKLLHKSMKANLIKNKVRLNRAKLKKLNLIAEHRADENYTIVGAASILAKTSSDDQYKKYKKKYGDFGSGSPGDPKTRFFVWQHRKSPLPIIRTSWNTFKTLVNLENYEDDPLYILRKNRK